MTISTALPACPPDPKALLRPDPRTQTSHTCRQRITRALPGLTSAQNSVRSSEHASYSTCKARGEGAGRLISVWRTRAQARGRWGGCFLCAVCQAVAREQLPTSVASGCEGAASYERAKWSQGSSFL
eukprot:345508-Chlamydomonas_euryale.AAC.3